MGSCLCPFHGWWLKERIMTLAHLLFQFTALREPPSAPSARPPHWHPKELSAPTSYYSSYSTPPSWLFAGSVAAPVGSSPPTTPHKAFIHYPSCVSGSLLGRSRGSSGRAAWRALGSSVGSWGFWVRRLWWGSPWVQRLLWLSCHIRRLFETVPEPILCYVARRGTFCWTLNSSSLPDTDSPKITSTNCCSYYRDISATMLTALLSLLLWAGWRIVLVCRCLPYRIFVGSLVRVRVEATALFAVFP